jgi:hypothetical protein
MPPKAKADVDRRKSRRSVSSDEAAAGEGIMEVVDFMTVQSSENEKRHLTSERLAHDEPIIHPRTAIRQIFLVAQNLPRTLPHPSLVFLLMPQPHQWVFDSLIFK